MTEEFTAHYRLPIPQFNSVPWHQQWELSLRAVDEALYLSTVSRSPMWTNSTAYYIGSMTLDAEQGTLWICVEDHTSSAYPALFSEERVARPGIWQGVTAVPAFRGEWQPDTTYNTNDFVISGSEYAVAISAHISGVSFTADKNLGFWTVLVDVGTVSVGINDIAPASLPAAATVDLGSVTSSRVTITGTHGLISSFGSAPNLFKIVTVGANGNTFNHSASIDLPNSADLVMYAGDVIAFASSNTGVWKPWAILRKTSSNTFNDIKQVATQFSTGVVELATNAETLALTDTSRAVTPSNLAALDSSTTQQGLVTLATNPEATAKAHTTHTLTPSNLAALDASLAASGFVQLATGAEVRALTDATKVITPSTLGTCDATTTQQGIVAFATDAETALGTSTTKALTPSNLTSLVSTTADPGLVRFATDVETLALTIDTAAVTPGNLGALQASQTQPGIVELATSAEALALANIGLALTPGTLGAVISSTTQRGIHRFATAAEAQAGTSTIVGLTPSNLADAVATKAQIEAETTNRTVTAANAMYISGAAKSYASADSSGNLLFSYNVSNVVDGGVGIAQFGIDTDMSNAVYPALGIAAHASATDLNVITDPPTVSAVTLRCFNSAGALTDPSRWHAVAYGTRSS